MLLVGNCYFYQSLSLNEPYIHYYMKTDLQEHLGKFTTNPYLFVGSGLLRRFINLPTWEELLISFYTDSTIVGIWC